MKFGKLTARFATRRFWLRLIACLVLAMVVFVVGMRVYWRVQLKREIARIKAEGYPTTFEELNAFYPAVPDDAYLHGVARRALSPSTAPRRSMP